MKRRDFITLLAGAGSLAVTPRALATEDYPTRPVRWIIGFPPGGGCVKTSMGDAFRTDQFCAYSCSY